MDLVEQNYDQAIENVMKVYIAQMNSAIKISKIMCEHSGNDDELSGDHVICGLIYRLMVPMTDEDMMDSLNKADDILNGEDSSEDESDEDEDEELCYEIPKDRRQTPKARKKLFIIKGGDHSLSKKSYLNKMCKELEIMIKNIT